MKTTDIDIWQLVNYQALDYDHVSGLGTPRPNKEDYGDVTTRGVTPPASPPTPLSHRKRTRLLSLAEEEARCTTTAIDFFAA